MVGVLILPPAGKIVGVLVFATTDSAGKIVGVLVFYWNRGHSPKNIMGVPVFPRENDGCPGFCLLDLSVLVFPLCYPSLRLV